MNLEIAMAARLYRRLGSLPDLPNLISVHAHNGIVILQGRLPSMQLQHDVFDAVAQTNDVREIIDRIQLGFNPVLVPVWSPDLGTGESRSPF